MSASVSAMVWQCEQPDPAMSLLLIKLAECANDSGVCYPCLDTVADHCKMTPRSIKTRLTILEKNGYLSISDSPFSVQLFPHEFAVGAQVAPSKPVKQDNCPYDEMLALYTQIFTNPDESDTLVAVKVLTKKRKKSMRWLYQTLRSDIQKVGNYFSFVWRHRENWQWIFSNNDRKWKADIEYLCREETYAKVKEHRLTDWGKTYG